MLGPVISLCLGRTPVDDRYSVPEMLDDYARMYKICIAAEEFIEKSSGSRAKDSNLQTFRSVMPLYINGNINSYTDTFSGFPGEIITNLVAINNNLEAAEVDSIVDEKEIDRLIALIDEFTKSVANSNIPSSLKNRLLQTLSILRDALLRVNLIGPEPVLDEIDRVLGQMVQYAGTDSDSEEEHKEKRGLMEKAATLAENVQKVVVASKDIAPLALVAFDAVQRIIEKL